MADDRRKTLKLLADFHIGGEWFHLTPGVRAVIQTVVADEPE
jgi:hypothetical protein